MRNIKFRAWDEGKMNYSDNQNHSMGLWAIHTLNSETGLSRIYMQYTGLKDKNGKEIYEGDIVRNITQEGKVEKTGVISWATTEWEWCGHYMISEALGYARYEPEVIGNIYENSGLLGAEV